MPALSTNQKTKQMVRSVMNLQEVLVVGAIMVGVHQVAQKEQAVQQQTQAHPVIPQQQSQITKGQINHLTVQQTIVAASLALVLVAARAVVHHHHKEALS